MFLTFKDEDLWAAKDIINFFMRRPFESDNPPPIILKELPFDDQILVLNTLINYYPLDYRYNFRMLQKLCIALIKINKKNIAYDVLDVALRSKRINRNQGDELVDFIGEFQINPIETYQNDYKLLKLEFQNRLKPEKLQTYEIFGMKDVVKEFLEILIEFCDNKISQEG